MVKTESFNNAQSRVFCILACHQLSVSGNLDLKVTDQLLVWQGVETKFHFDVWRASSCHCNNCPNISRVSEYSNIIVSNFVENNICNIVTNHHSLSCKLSKILPFSALMCYLTLKTSQFFDSTFIKMQDYGPINLLSDRLLRYVLIFEYQILVLDLVVDHCVQK